MTFAFFIRRVKVNSVDSLSVAPTPRDLLWWFHCMVGISIGFFIWFHRIRILARINFPVWLESKSSFHAFWELKDTCGCWGHYGREKLNADWENLDFWATFMLFSSKLWNKILLCKFGHRFVILTKMFIGWFNRLKDSGKDKLYDAVGMYKLIQTHFMHLDNWRIRVAAGPFGREKLNADWENLDFWATFVVFFPS